ncbi:MAG: single-stranded-DNA-specific exonuclease RecJ [Armatimonadetes bacterium]|nr:single-stranded-DNA-specific exonuclease RecJ [Armatimonadota bacterium]MDW8122199.1 single-stranded-DNA-specific exonuclease RecJ [Armatimonadota bacterium]
MRRSWRSIIPEWWKEKRVWEVRRGAEVTGKGDLPTLLKKILVSRGLVDDQEQKDFLFGRTEEKDDRHPQLEAAVSLIEDAIKEKGLTLIHGDYDADGISAAALMHWTLSRLGVPTRSFLPSRFRDGYGVQPRTIMAAQKEGVRFLITVDCGTTSVEAINKAMECGMKVLIVDHHRPGDELPRCHVHLNPKADGRGWEFVHYSAAGLAWKLCRALLKRVGRDDWCDELPVELAAVGTVADMVPLVGGNRDIVRQGIRFLREGRHIGLRALLEVASVKRDFLRSFHLAFIVGPRINAAGRMGDPKPSFHLLLTRDESYAYHLASYLNAENQKRQREEDRVLEQALEACQRENFGRTIVLISPKQSDQLWSPGVIGIVAARLVEIFHRPSFLITFQDGKGVGSARGIEGFSIAEALSSCRKHLISGGGHDMAGGFQIEPENIPYFTNALEQYAATNLPDDFLMRRLSIDAEVEVHELRPASLCSLVHMEPIGLGNPRPVLWLKNVHLLKAIRKGYKDTLLIEREGVHLEVTGENLIGAIENEIGNPYWHLCLSPDGPTGGNDGKWELRVVDLCPAHSDRVTIRVI